MKKNLFKERKLIDKKHYAMGYWFVVIIACLMVVVLASSNLFVDYLRAHYSPMNTSLDIIKKDDDGEINTVKVKSVLNKGLPASPNANGTKTYISDLIMSSDDYSADAAKSRLIQQGYSVIDQDMNEGTYEGYVYLGYKTTTDKSLAITDISIMNMKGDYRLMDYADVAKDKEDNINSLVGEFKTMLLDYQNKIGSSATAELARLGLNKITCVAPKTGKVEPLGDFLLDPNKYDHKFLYDMLLMSNSAVVSGIYNYLTFAVQNNNYQFDIDGQLTVNPDEKSWINKIVYKDLDAEWPELESKVFGVFPFLEEFSQGCQNAITKSEKNEEETGKKNELPPIGKDEDQILEEYRASDMETAMEQDTESIYLASYLRLQEIPYRDGTLADLFVPRGKNEEGEEIFLSVIMEDFASLVDSVTPAQYAAIHSGNFISLLNNAFLDQKAYDESKLQIKNAFDGKTLDLFYGVDKKIFEKKVGVTDAAYRQMSASNNYDIAAAPDSTVLSQVNTWVSAGTGVIMFVTGTIGLIKALGALFPTLFAKFATATAILSFTKLTIVGTVCSVLNWACLALIVVVLLTMLGFWIADLVNYYHPKYTPIPSRMYDVKGDNYVAYDAIKDLRKNQDKFNNGDLNNFNGLQWNAVYVTRDTRCGDPLMLDNNAPGGNAVFKIQRGYNTALKGYEPVTGFGERAATNTNSYTYHDYVGGIYLYYLVDGILTADKIVQRKKYISQILLRTEKNEAAARYYLENKGLEVINVNLTAGMKERATFIGIQTTDVEASALTDIRIAYGTNQAQIMFGASSYGMCGFSGKEPDKIADNVTGPITNYEYALYSTSNKDRGSAILADLIIRSSLDTSNSGAEPINLFSGGGVFDFRTANQGMHFNETIPPMYVYFMPSVKYTSGVKYLGGIYAIKNGANRTYYVSDSQVRKNFHDKFVGTRIVSGYDDEYKDTYGNILQLYTTTYNPKRAIGDLITFQQMTDDAQNFVTDRMTAPDTLSNRGLGFVACEFIIRDFESFYGAYVMSFQYNKMVFNTPLYVMPATNDCPALVMDKDIKFFAANSYREIPSGYRNISAQNNYYGKNTDYFTTKPSVWNDDEGEFQLPSYQPYVYIITNRPQPIKPKYINTVIPSFSQVDYYAIDYARMSAAAMGAEDFVNIADQIPFPYNLNAENVADEMYGVLGITYTKKKTEALRDVALYYVDGKAAPNAGSMKNTHDVPPTKITRFGIDYTRATSNGIYAGNVNGSHYYYLYFYVSHQSIAGSPISKIYFDKKMMGIAGETSKVLSYGPDSIQGFYYLHIERDEPDNYVTHIAAEYDNAYGSGDVLYNKATYNWFGEAWIDREDYALHYLQMFGCTVAVNGNLNHNSYGRVDDEPVQCTLGYDYGPRSMAITDIVARMFPGGDWYALTSFYESLSKPLVINGITYELSPGAINRNGLPIYLYYTRDKRAGSPIINLIVDYTEYRGWQDGWYNPYWEQWETVKFTPDSGMGKNRNANVTYGAKEYDTAWSNRVFIKYLREDRSVGKGNTSSIASVFTDSTAVLIICFTVVISSGATALIIYGKNKKRKKDLFKK